VGKKVLVVTTVSADESELRNQLADADEIRVVAPAAKISRLDWLTNAEDDARDAAEQAAEDVADAAGGEARVQVDSTSQNTDAAENVADALRNFPADEIVVLTQPGEDATWLEDEAVRKALEAHGIPVRHLELTDS
jgi:ABC-type sugar transport system substrate-binding protein